MNKSTLFQPVGGVVLSGILPRLFPPFLAVTSFRESARTLYPYYKLPLGDEKIDIGGNTVVIGYNEDYDEKLSVVDEDGYLYYENNMDFYPQNDNLILEKQIQLAKDISKKLSGHGISLEIIAEFENLLFC